jgi:hypothetical protein
VEDKKFHLVKENKGIRVKRVFDDGLFRYSVIGGVSYMIFKSDFKGSINLTYERFGKLFGRASGRVYL